MAATLLDVCAVVPAAGFGRRMQTECPKQYLSIGNKTILEHSVFALLAHPRVTRVIIAISPGDSRFAQLPLAQHPQITVVDGEMNVQTLCWPDCRPPETPNGCWCMMRRVPAYIRMI